MIKKLRHLLLQALERIVRELLKLTILRVAILFVTVAVLVSMTFVATIDLLWDGSFNAELEFAGVVVPFLDSLLIVGLLVALLNAVRKEATRRQAAEESLSKLNEELEARVQVKTGQLLAAQDELVRSEKLAVLGQVAGSVGHELRNPLGVMSNAVYFLQTVLSGADDSVKEYLNIIKGEIAASERIVSDLLDSVRTKPPQPENTGVRELLEQTLGKCAVPATVAVKLDIPETLSPLHVDAQQIHQVFRNLISNGIEAMQEGGTLEIRASEDVPAKTISISVKDSGSGIDPEVLKNLFQPLFTTKARGIGLGLVVVKNLTQANGGTVIVKSEAGKGTQFTVTLPAADETGMLI
jgi:signal transduction histidine kinase